MNGMELTEQDRYSTPVLDLRQLLGAQELGNLLRLWAEDPASIDEANLARIKELGDLFSIDLVTALHQFQQAHREREAEFASKMVSDVKELIVSGHGFFAAPIGPMPGANPPRTVGEFFNNSPLPKRHPQPVPGNPNEPRQDSGPRDADRVVDELTALRIKNEAEGLTDIEFSRLKELEEIMQEHASATNPKLITHQPDYNPGTLVDVPEDVVNGSTDTAHIPLADKN